MTRSPGVTMVTPSPTASTVAEDGGEGDDRLALLEVQIASADAGGAHLHQHLPPLRRIELHRLEGVGLVDIVEHGSGDAHVGPPRLRSWSQRAARLAETTAIVQRRR